jgi:hypothetical protein
MMGERAADHWSLGAPQIANNARVSQSLQTDVSSYSRHVFQNKQTPEFVARLERMRSATFDARQARPAERDQSRWVLTRPTTTPATRIATSVTLETRNLESAFASEFRTASQAGPDEGRGAVVR